MKIGVFDSGVGGLNVLKELIKKFPNNHYIYYGDTKNVPYGNKTTSELLKLSLSIIHYFEDKQVELIIIACGTISSNCYQELQKATNIPLISIIEPTINYINNSKYNNIGLIGTNKTIESNIFQKQIINKKIIAKATPSFVPIIENNLQKQKKKEIILELDVFQNKVDCIILGCTHYPLIGKIIKDYLNIPLIDMGKCLADNLSLQNKTNLQIELFFSALNAQIYNNIETILKEEKSNLVINLIDK